MANIVIELGHGPIDGQPITFAAPCDCSAVTGIKVTYPNGYGVFTFKDAHGNDLTKVNNLFAAGAYVKAILDVANGYAYLQNADTNAYLEEQLANKAPKTHTHDYLPLAGGMLSGPLKIGGDARSIGLGTGSNDVYVHNNVSGKYLRLKDDGTLTYGNSKIYHEGHKPTASDVGAVPTSRTINNKPLSGNISLSASDVGAAASSHGNHVPATQTANSATFLRNDNTWQKVTPANIGAAKSDHTHKEIIAADGVGTVSFGYESNNSEGFNYFFRPSNEQENDRYFLGSSYHPWHRAYIDSLTVGSLTSALPVASGGTGATTAAGARDKLGITPANIGAAATSHGNHVPATQTANNAKFLRNDNTWQTVTPANIGAVSITSLWTNSSPTSQFNAQSISKTLSSYDALLILTRTHKDNSYTYGATETSLIVRVGGSGMIHDTSESGAYLVSRKVTVTTSKITFGNAEYATTYGKSGLTASNNSLIPTYIYGINW